MKQFVKARYRLAVFVLFVCVIALYAWTYAKAPFSEAVNTYIVNGATTVAAGLAAIILTRTVFFFQPGEPPRVIWFAFAICLWLWAIAEGIWGYLYTTLDEVPLFSAADVLWLIGYIALTVSLAQQFLVIYQTQKSTVLWAALGVWFAVIATIETILLATHSSAPIEDFFRYFYVCADTGVGLAALFLVRAFRGRALAIPWLAISCFVITDILYVRLTETGLYDYVMSGISIALLADTLYLAVYLMVAWGAFEQCQLLRQDALRSQAGS